MLSSPPNGVRRANVSKSPAKIGHFDIEPFRAPEGALVDLEQWPTLAAPVYASKRAYRKMLDSHVAALSDMQQRFYAADRHSLLILFQAMDAAGKDGAIKHVMSGVNPQGCQVTSFKHPSAGELQHDFLWRSTRELPSRGQIGIFNRSYYEEVLVVRVHESLLRAEGLPEPHGAEAVWSERFESIRGLEGHLTGNGTRIVKIFLHLSREEQRKRFLARIDDPAKNWKFSQADIVERGHWAKYRAAYEAAIAATSVAAAPWWIVPADDKRNARLIVSQIILDTLGGLDLSYPRLDAARKRELEAIRKGLMKKCA